MCNDLFVRLQSIKICVREYGSFCPLTVNVQEGPILFFSPLKEDSEANTCQLFVMTTGAVPL